MSRTHKILGLVFVIVSLVFGIFAIAYNGYYVIDDIITWGEIWWAGVINLGFALFVVIFNILALIMISLLMRESDA
jgi:hypothetical protein